MLYVSTTREETYARSVVAVLYVSTTREEADARIVVEAIYACIIE